MSAHLIRSRSSETAIAIGLALLILLAGGCRQDPSPGTQYYERELVQMQKAERQAATTDKFIKDGYPWRGKETQPCMPCRIKITEKIISTEIDYLRETVHGKKKIRVRFRD